MAKYNLLIIEDHSLTRFGLKTAFENDSSYAGIYEAANAKDGLEIADKKNIDIILMDLGLPDINGIEATKIIKEKHPDIKIVILSSHEKKEDVISSLKAGAVAYCTKDVEPERLIEIVSSVLQGASWFDSKVAQFVLNAAVSQNELTVNSVKTQNSTAINLTTREKQVLKLIAQGLSNNDIAKKLDVSINTTKAHVCSILQKMSVNDRTQAAIKAIRDNII